MGSLQWEIVYSMQSWVSNYKRKKSMDHISLVRESLQSQEPSGAEFNFDKMEDYTKHIYQQNNGLFLLICNILVKAYAKHITR